MCMCYDQRETDVSRVWMMQCGQVWKLSFGWSHCTRSETPLKKENSQITQQEQKHSQKAKTFQELSDVIIECSMIEERKPKSADVRIA